MSQNGDGELSFAEKEKIACARYMGMSPTRVIDVEHSSDGNGGAKFVVRFVIHPGCDLETFVNRAGNGVPKR